MAKGGRWTLAELLNFEWILRRDGESAPAEDRAVFRKVVKPAIAGVRDRTEQRRLGLLEWLRVKTEGEGKELPGGKFVAGLGFASAGLGVVFFLSGVSLVLGLLERPESLYNVGHFLLATLGVQWMILLVGLGLYLVRRRLTDSLGLVGRLIFWVVKKIAPEGEKAWGALVKEGGRYSDVCAWTLARVGQWAGVGFNVGLIVGLVGVLAFKDVRFYWETTSQSAPEKTWETVVNGVAVPWKYVVPTAVPSAEEVAAARLVAGGAVNYAPTRTGNGWPLFMVAAVVFWGLLPRLGLLILTVMGRRKAFSQLDFQAPGHRELWRRMSHVERAVETTGQEDEAVVIEVGGLDVALKDVTPFLRSRLRVHPLALYQVGVLDESKEADAYAALKVARGGVVFLAEGWSLSPRQMTRLHAEVRKHCGADVQVWMVVLGSDGEAPSEPDMLNWKEFVDGLEDVACEVVGFEVME